MDQSQNNNKFQALPGVLAKVRSDERFASMKPWQRRVAVAQDVLDQLRSGAMRAANWIYLSSCSYNSLDREAQVSEVIADGCRVCALGAMFVAAAKRFDHLRVRDFSSYVNDRRMRGYLEAVFSREQLCAMECAFEGFSNLGAYRAPGPVHCFNARVAGARLRLERIMRNVVRNRGTFDPLREPERKRPYPTYEEEECS